MEIDDILIYILGGLFLLGGLLRKRKKPTQQVEIEVEDEPAFSGQGVQDFDDWLMGKEVVVQPQSVPATPEKKIVRNQNADIFSDFRAKEKIVQRTKPKKNPNLDSILTAVNSNNTNLNIELNTVEDARKAFIYSEIFQRKY